MNERDRERRQGGGDAGATRERTFVPGKNSNVDGSGPRKGEGPGKRAATDDLAPDDIHAAAAAGFSGPGAPLPFLDVIQRAFGHHDVSGIQAHTDGAAQEAAASIGAGAYAQGNRIAFAQTPDLHTAAHEAAHVVQQRRGVSPAGGVGARGDAHEEHANAVARLVVSGQSAAGLLDRISGAGGSSTAVQRKTPGEVDAPDGGVPVAGAPAPAGDTSGTPEPPEKGENEHKQIGKWASYTSVSTTTTIGLYQTEAEAMANAHSSGAVILEKGKYVAYRVTTGALFDSFTYKNCKVLVEGDWTNVEINAPWLAVTTQDGVVLRPSKFNMEGAVKQMTPEQMLKPGESPFGGFDKTIGKDSTGTITDEKLFAAFEAAMKKGSLAILENSRKQVEDKNDQFRFKSTKGDEFALIRDTAKRLVQLDQQIDQAEGEAAPPLGAAAADRDTVAKALKREDAKKKADALRQQRKVAVQDYPMLARQDPKAIQGASDDTITKLLGTDTMQILRDIPKTREDVLTGAVDLWAVSSIVDTTIAGCSITDADRRKRILNHAKELQRSASIKKGVLTVFAIGLGLVAAASTGGLALVASAGALGLSTYDALETTKQYAVDSSAANTDLDPEKALVAKDVAGEWKWVVVAWVGVGLDIGTVASALKGVKSIEEVAHAAEQISQGSKTLLDKLRIAANITKEGEVLTEATRGVVAMKLGTKVSVQQGLGTEIRVLYEVDRETGRVAAKGAVVGEKALVKDILMHSELVGALNRYEGFSGKVRELVEKMLSVAKKAPVELGHNNPFPAGSQAFESWHEVNKLEKILPSKLDDLAKGQGFITKEAEDLLKREIKFLEDDLARHKLNVEQLVLEEGRGYIAKGEEVTALAKEKGWPFPDVPKADRKWYYYRRDGESFELCTRQDAPGNIKRFSVTKEKTLVEGAPSVGQKGKLLVAGWEKERQAAFATLQELEAAGSVHRVVPLQGIAKTDAVLGQAFSASERLEMVSIYKRAIKAKNPKMTKAACEMEALSIVNGVMTHDITFVKGTEQLRLFDYAKQYPGKAIGELHHDIPLYLGGNHQLLTDIGKVEGAGGKMVDLHDELHALIDKAKFPDGSTLAPHDLAKRIPTQPGAAVLLSAGSIDFYVFQGDKLVKLN